MSENKIKNKKGISPGLLLIFIILAVIFFLLSACSNKTDIKALLKDKLKKNDEMSIAVSVVEDFFDYIKDEKYEKAYDFLSSKDKEKHSPEEFEEEFKNVTQITSFEIKWVEVKNNIANVGMDLTDFYDNDEKVYKDLTVSLLKEEDGSWGINFWN
jgi:hypothetical protein